MIFDRKIPKIRSSNPAIGKILHWTYFLLAVEKKNIKKKEAGNGSNTDLNVQSMH